VELDVHGRAGGVPAGVGQRLLNDPVGGELDPRAQRGHAAADDQPGAGPAGLPGLVDQLVELLEARLGLPARLGAGVLAQQPQQPAHLVQSRPGGVADGGQPLGPLGGHARRGQAGDLGLDGDHGDVVGDDVVQLTGDPRPLPAGGVLQQGGLHGLP
jgi:hypothetical protein